MAELLTESGVATASGRRDLGRRARARFWRWSRHSQLAYPVVMAVRRRPGRRFVGPRTDLVIDGFERSGNTFAYFAFLDANGDRFRIGHHTHSTAQLHWARRLHVPAVVPVREPDACALSAAIRWPERALDDILEDYITFHARVTDLTDHVDVVDFDRITTDFGGVVADLNDRHGTTFTRFTGDDEARERVFAAIDDHTRAGLGHLDTTALPRPSAERATRRSELEGALDTPGTAKLLARAQRQYAELVEVARSS